MPYRDKAKEKQYRHEYYLKHKERWKERNDAYRKTHREELREQSKKNCIKYNEYYKRYRLKHAEKNKKYQKEYKLKNPEKIRELNRKYRKAHETELKKYKRTRNETVWNDATYKLNYAKRKGRVVQLPCEVCGAEKSQAHHCDYNKPLEVVWLCQKHHSEWHQNNTPIYSLEG